jgi:hypothetical protein
MSKQTESYLRAERLRQQELFADQSLGSAPPGHPPARRAPARARRGGAMTKRTESDLRAELCLQRELLAGQLYEQFDIALTLQRNELEEQIAALRDRFDEQIADLRRRVGVLSDQVRGDW